MTLSTPTLLAGATSSADSSTYTTASVTVPAGARVVMFVSSGKAANLSEVPTGVSHPSIGALTLVRSTAVANNNQTLSMWTGVGTGVAGAFTITHTGIMDNAAWHVVSFTSDVATPTIAQSAASTTTSSGTLTTPLPNSVAAGSCVLSAVGVNSANTTTPTVGTGYTQLGTLLYVTSPTIQQATEYDNSSPYGTPAWGFAAVNGRCQLAVEVADGTAPPAGTGQTVWNGTAEVPIVSRAVWNGTSEVPIVSAAST